ncbi:hypothetical protein [Anaeromyxobacter paludicola]|uniref:Uncharacterized protein n=1 Tax=Anaeromyxobacter paludicola TaxID=2918171 RepID=A0ABM7XE73_9BACT|nr:hypothetical protein [Anaeromyxobacter paludicola]BDG10181.1 hypothetical protein AMPC_32940 [Anaeromyxobacter paludicola]
MRSPSLLRALPALTLLASAPAFAAGRADARVGVSCRVVRSARITVAAAPGSAAAPRIAPAAFVARVNGQPAGAATWSERVGADGVRYPVLTVMADATP